jgi:hypothetical protein
MNQSVKRIITLSLAFSIAMATPASEVQGTSLCNSNEDVVFSCTLKNKKSVSICRAKRASGDLLTYRFGKPKAVEMEYSDVTGPTSTFRYESYFRYQVNYFDLSFERDGHTYLVYRKWDEENPVAQFGLDVSFPSNRKPLRMVCAAEINDENFGKTTDVACDMDSMFGCERKADWK